MQHAVIVRHGDSGAQLARDLDGLVLREASDAAQERSEVLAIDILHADEGHPVRLADVEDAADVGMRDLARDAHLAMETRECDAIQHELFRQEFQGDVLVEFQVFGAIDLAHPAASDERDDAISVGEERAGKDASALGTERCAGTARSRRRR